VEFRDGPTKRITEEIMTMIRPHLKVESPPQENHHYNRVYEEIYEILERSNLT
jgi:hypothetical protein